MRPEHQNTTFEFDEPDLKNDQVIFKNLCMGILELVYRCDKYSTTELSHIKHLVTCQFFCRNLPRN